MAAEWFVWGFVCPGETGSDLSSPPRGGMRYFYDLLKSLCWISPPMAFPFRERDDLSIIKGKLHWPASQKIFWKACSVWVLWLEHSKLGFEPNVCCLCASFKTQDLKIALVVADVLDPTKSKILSHLGNNKKNALDLGQGFIRLFLFSSPFSVLSKKWWFY